MEKLRLGSHDLNDGLLELKSLSQITDEHAKKVVDSGHKIEFLNEGWRLSLGKVVFDYKRNAIDFLRGNSYALDWTTPEGETIAVKEQIEFGWIKLKSDEKITKNKRRIR